MSWNIPPVAQMRSQTVKTQIEWINAMIAAACSNGKFSVDYVSNSEGLDAIGSIYKEKGYTTNIDKKPNGDLYLEISWWGDITSS